MKFSRDNNCTLHTIHVVEAETPREAAKKYKEEMQKASAQMCNDNKKPDYINLKKADWLPEIWSEALRFYSDDDAQEYDSDGMSVPDKYDDEFADESDNGFVWGLKSYDDLSAAEACAYTMNDIDIMYIDGQYILSIEEIYIFDTEQERVKYLEGLADKLREYVLTKGYTKEEVDNLGECHAFSKYYPTVVMRELVSMKAYTLLDLYRRFRLFVEAYKSVMRVCRKIT